MASATDGFEWVTQADAFARVLSFVDRVEETVPFVSHLASRLRSDTGTRLIDWVDRIGCTEPAAFEAVGYEQVALGGEVFWQHPGAMLPVVFETAQDTLAIHVDSVLRFLVVHGLDERVAVCGEPTADVRRACVAEGGGCEFHVVERHGSIAWEPGPPAQFASVARHAERFRLRRRSFDTDAEGFDRAETLFREAADDLGTNRACDLFFAAEREYWQSRNHAARVQYARQEKLGLGWANQDHHTYRSGRAAFARLIEVLELMGFGCRERFYAGADAGWGAQVLEQPHCRVTIFADVDLSPEEITGDFAHSQLPDQQQPGTVGLWCELHGEAFLEAGMHHLECQFDFDAAREQLAAAGVQSMAPFTDFSHLRQAFTVGERWDVQEPRLQSALERGSISAADAERFRAEGVIGSHLEILERNDGYKGFNKTGISEIILETNPRTAGQS